MSVFVVCKELVDAPAVLVVSLALSKSFVLVDFYIAVHGPIVCCGSITHALHSYNLIVVSVIVILKLKATRLKSKGRGP